jgi:predicted nucleic acid-binding protein
MYRFGALRKWQLGTDMASTLLELVPDVLPVGQEDMVIALDLYGRFGPQGVMARDVVHAAVMIKHEITHIISTDRHFDLLPGIVRLDPQDLFTASIS